MGRQLYIDKQSHIDIQTKVSQVKRELNELDMYTKVTNEWDLSFSKETYPEIDINEKITDIATRITHLMDSLNADRDILDNIVLTSNNCIYTIDLEILEKE